ncbi:nitroreductase family deazaflavin-dependent oxidoreductase [Phycicoccus sp. BSK3Z-2]|uniref:Nitroreductase family deazaflavin-dependent oxidoreductase n=1 Tax=Phycicoccus avicenniae TaxID=2828860 RepID=A0A941DCT9_9MICO|nr:nitroreductase/quinone reductase family protein [Phycicoccus avicenniae]MBR7743982.1 nitroreductase family deazaflavin-dependent oxidoreductase [Phycicoccus avicenniae]
MSDWNQQIIDEFRANGGTVGTMGFGRALVLLHHVGARSGTERIAPLAHIRDSADRWFVAASKAGAPDNPDWYHNLRAHPEVAIETPDDGTVEVRARVLDGDERDAAWARFEEMSDGFKGYQEKTSRVIPVVALERR